MEGNGDIAEYTELKHCEGIYYGSYTAPTVPVRYQLRGLDVYGIPFTDIVSDFFAIDNNEIVVLESNITVPHRGSSVANLYIKNIKKGPSVLDVHVSINCTDLDVEYSNDQLLTLIPQKVQAFHFELFDSETSAMGTTNCTAIIVETCSNTSIVQDFEIIVIGIIHIDVTGVSESVIMFEWTTPKDFTGDANYAFMIDFNNGTTSIIVLDSDTFSFTLTGLHPYQFVDITLLSPPELIGNATVSTQESGTYCLHQIII